MFNSDLSFSLLTKGKYYLTSGMNAKTQSLLYKGPVKHDLVPLNNLKTLTFQNCLMHLQCHTILFFKRISCLSTVSGECSENLQNCIQTSHLFLCPIFRMWLVIVWVPFIYTCVLSECSIGVEVPVILTSVTPVEQLSQSVLPSFLPSFHQPASQPPTRL